MERFPLRNEDFPLLSPLPDAEMRTLLITPAGQRLPRARRGLASEAGRHPGVSEKERRKKIGVERGASQRREGLLSAGKEAVLPRHGVHQEGALVGGDQNQPAPSQRIQNLEPQPPRRKVGDDQTRLANTALAGGSKAVLGPEPFGSAPVGRRKGGRVNPSRAALGESRSEDWNQVEEGSARPGHGSSGLLPSFRIFLRISSGFSGPCCSAVRYAETASVDLPRAASTSPR